MEDGQVISEIINYSIEMYQNMTIVLFEMKKPVSK